MRKQEMLRRVKETQRKIEAISAEVEIDSQNRIKEGVSGRVTVEYIWDQGYIKRAILTTQRILDDLPEEQNSDDLT